MRVDSAVPVADNVKDIRDISAISFKIKACVSTRGLGKTSSAAKRGISLVTRLALDFVNVKSYTQTPCGFL